MTWCLNHGIMSSKPTDYLLDYDCILVTQKFLHDCQVRLCNSLTNHLGWFETSWGLSEDIFLESSSIFHWLRLPDVSSVFEMTVSAIRAAVTNSIIIIILNIYAAAHFQIQLISSVQYLDSIGYRVSVIFVETTGRMKLTELSRPAY